MMNKSNLFIIVLAILSLVFYACESESPTNDETGDTAEWQTVFFDDFNRSDGPAGSNYSALIYNPSEGLIDSTLSISNNMLQLSGGIYYAIIYVNEVTNDVIRVSLKCSTTAAPSGSYIFGVCAKSRILGNECKNIMVVLLGWMKIQSLLLKVLRVILLYLKLMM